MAYRRYARKKTSLRRKRTYRKKKMMYRRRGKADRGHLEKITKMIPLTVDASTNFATMQVNWLATGISGQLEAFVTGGNANASQQFQQCATMYREYYISSLKIEYRPVHVDAGNNPGLSVNPIQCGTAMDRLLPAPIDPVEIRNAIDYKMYDWTRPFKRFYRVRTYAKQKSLVWRSSNDALTGNAGAFNVLPNCQTLLHCVCAGLAAGSSIGEVQCTWYVRFHHRQRAAN